MGFKIAIRETATGEIRVHSFDFDWTEHSFFWLSRHNGNYGCDCNRELAFLRAGGMDPEWDDTECGDERFDILYAELPDGTHVQVDGRS